MPRGKESIFVAKNDEITSDFTLTFPIPQNNADYPRRDGQAELTWVVGYTERSKVTPVLERNRFFVTRHDRSASNFTLKSHEVDQY